MIFSVWFCLKHFLTGFFSSPCSLCCRVGRQGHCCSLTVHAQLFPKDCCRPWARQHLSIWLALNLQALLQPYLETFRPLSSPTLWALCQSSPYNFKKPLKKPTVIGRCRGALTTSTFSSAWDLTLKRIITDSHSTESAGLCMLLTYLGSAVQARLYMHKPSGAWDILLMEM